jgi:hypothetical protein
MGHGVSDGPLGGLLVIALVTLGFGAMVGAALYLPEIERALGRIGRRVAPAPDRPVGEPIEQIAHDARRLRAELATISIGTPMVRRRGLSRAYDDVLLDACRALGVPDTLSGLAPGVERDSERLHVEHALEQVGLVLSA